MGRRLKEDEPNDERTINALLKQSENRRCIDCGILGIRAGLSRAGQGKGRHGGAGLESSGVEWGGGLAN
ncbi:unnamed protein product [Calypogeia fissa]